MVLFFEFERRQKLYRYEISDLYVMALTFGISFAVTRIVKSVVEKQLSQIENSKSKHVQIANLKGGASELPFFDEAEIGACILASIADDKNYGVKDPKVISVIFNLTKTKLKDTSLVITPNMMRFLALKLLENSSKAPLLIKIGNSVISSDNRNRLLVRSIGSTAIGILSSLYGLVGYGILIIILFFDSTQNCGYKCSNYFEQLPDDQPVRIFADKPTGQFVIAGNDDASQVEIYTPLPTSEEKVNTNNGEVKVSKTYAKSRKKAKQVNFNDFKKTDKVLSAFDDLEEPYVPQKVCPIENVENIIDVTIE